MKTITVLLLAFLGLSAYGQELAQINVSAGPFDRHDCPVSIPLDQLGVPVGEGSFVLVETTGGMEKEIATQPEPGSYGRLWFILQGRTAAGSSRQFTLKAVEKSPVQPSIVLNHYDEKLTISDTEKPVLVYHYGTQFPPEGVDPVYQRSGFVHPLYSPGGQVLTRIQPPDHYHHYGIWGPWTKTYIKGREVDFWNLVKGQGTVRFSDFLSQYQGPVYTGFRAHQEHIDFGGRGADQVAISEILDIRVWNAGLHDAWLIDYAVTLNTPLDSGILLDAYRYGGGIGYRATGYWHRENSTVLTSENKDRAGADGTNARWCIIEGESDISDGRSGILFMDHPLNKAHPQPMRVWPPDMNGRGDVYFEFCPIRHESWQLEKGRDYALRYRMLVFDGAVSPERAEASWQDFAHPPSVEVIRTNQ